MLSKNGILNQHLLNKSSTSSYEWFLNHCCYLVLNSSVWYELVSQLSCVELLSKSCLSGIQLMWQVAGTIRNRNQKNNTNMRYHWNQLYNICVDFWFRLRTCTDLFNLFVCLFAVFTHIYGMGFNACITWCWLFVTVAVLVWLSIVCFCYMLFCLHLFCPFVDVAVVLFLPFCVLWLGLFVV